MSTRIEICQIRGRVSQDLRYWTKLFWKGCNQSGKWYTKIQTTSRPDHIWVTHWQEFGKQLKERNRDYSMQKTVFPEHAHGKPLFQNNKNQSVWSKIQLCWLCRRRGNLCCITTLCTNSPFLYLQAEVSACCLVSRHGVLVGQNSSSNPQVPGTTRYSQVWTWEERSTNFGCCSAQRVSGVYTYK